jgi:adenylylsulfate kinase-like enzyme
VSCANYYLAFEPSVMDGQMVIDGFEGEGYAMEGRKNAYSRIIYRVYERLHRSCYILVFSTISVQKKGFLLVRILRGTPETSMLQKSK